MRRIPAPARIALALALLTGFAPLRQTPEGAREVPAATQQEAREILRRASELLRAGDSLEALLQAERALARDGDLWEGHLVHGQALQALGDDLGARDAFLRAAEAAPGMPQAHFLAAASSLRLADFEVAWEQAIRAGQAGRQEGMERLLASLRDIDAEPEDLQRRLDAPRLRVVAGPEVDESVVRRLRQGIVAAPLLALVRVPAEHRLEIADDGAGRLRVRLQETGGKTLMERPLEGAAGGEAATIDELVASIEILLGRPDGRPR